MTTKYAYGLKKCINQNPFMDSQAKKFTEEQIMSEFFPTSKFWGIFNPQNEIYLGTRGSGKTILMRMASYNLLRKMKNTKAEKIISEKKFICFFIPLNLEFSTSVINANKNNEYFVFSVNCLSVEAFIDTLVNVVADSSISDREKKELNIRITEAIGKELTTFSKCIMLNDIRSEVARLYNEVEPWNDGDEKVIPNVLYKEILTPVLRMIDIINRCTNDLFSHTTWIACIDEAEFLKETHLKCINLFMRTTKKNLALKMTTLPTKHSTLETSVNGVFIEPNGNDFNYRWIDYDCDSAEYRELTNHIVQHRFAKAGTEPPILSLEQFLGTCGKDDTIDYFLAALGKSEEEGKRFLREKLVEELSQTRQKRFETIRDDIDKISSQYYEKFSPAFYLRYAKRENSIANRTFEWFIGSRTIRKISDGNPRRFIEIMNYIVNEMITKDLTKKELHKLIIQFTCDEERKMQTLPDYGFVLRALCEQIGSLIAEKIHGAILLDYGCNFYIDKKLFEDEKIKNALALGINYNHIKYVENRNEILTSETHFRLSFLHAVVHWLPMRVVDHPSPTVKPQHLELPFKYEYFNNSNSKELIKNYGLELGNDQD
jgi:hypothetical protein